jgi:rhodanese-related sulfurtransferase
MHKTVKSMVDEAMDVITTYSVDDARDLHGRDDVQFVDLSEWSDPEREGAIPRDRHCMLFCAMGWRSALASKTLQDMGLPREAF